MELAQFQPKALEVEQMKQYGILASVVRQDILTLAKETEEGLREAGDLDPQYHKERVKRLYRNIEGTELQTRVKMNADVFHRSPCRLSYKKLRCSELSVAQKVDVVHAVLVGKEHQ